MIRRFEFTSRNKSLFIGASIVGIVMIILGLVTGHDQQGRFWANFLLSSFFFTAISVLATAYMSIQYLASAAWSSGIKRIFEALSMYLPVGIIAILVLFLASFAGEKSGMHAIYEWTHSDVVSKDEVLTGKAGYLNMTFWLIRALVCMTIWTLAARAYRKYSLNEDEIGGMINYKKSFSLSAWFLPFFGLSFCVMSWDWLMSVQPHWYSTMFGVNIFAGALVGMLSLTNIIIVLMKKNGYLDWVNENHIHDISKWVFAFSIFWTYTWLSQYLLTWYANLPEETPFYLLRQHGAWKTLFFTNFTLNFICPLIMFMMRDAKRKMNWVLIVCSITLIGKFMDWYIIIMPTTAKEHAGFGFYEIGFWLFFGGIFAYIVSASLAKANLIPKNHPYLVESLHHDI